MFVDLDEDGDNRLLNPIAMTHAAQNAILDGVRKLDPTVENFTDVDRIVRNHPEWDLRIRKALGRQNGALSARPEPSSHR
ncbi:hypothetical protein [Novosphingobium endophyticum]|uniref:hypothetical protein n=1 Tax=Novosphingobium endophyticum TaxID=1955250 RepID=UPI0016681ACB|nr:hypothetical protein [Novosphingobium endophyticum]